MSVHYHGAKGERAAYECHRRRFQDGRGGMCWSVPARLLDQAVEAQVLQALTPAHLTLALEVLNQLEHDAHERDRQWQLQLERARYEAQRAERQFDAVEPENRLVARTLEQRWNEALQHLHELEQAYGEAQQAQRLEISTQERQQILRLAADLPALWQASTTTPAERKELLGLLVKQIALTPVEGPPRETEVQLLWHTMATTTLMVPRVHRKDRFRTSPEVIEAIMSLAPGRNNTAIAKALNARGLRSGRGAEFTKQTVAWLRRKYQIGESGSDHLTASHMGARADGRYSTRALATRLGVSISTIHYWREKGSTSKVTLSL
jgi:hypothetical protein